MKRIYFLITTILIICSSFQKKKSKQVLPSCIKQKIELFKRMEKHEQPQSVIEYIFKGKKVYYITMPCCDFFNELYDANCKLMGHPDGGITGQGDGKLPDFNKEKTKERIIWKIK